MWQYQRTRARDICTRICTRFLYMFSIYLVTCLVGDSSFRVDYEFYPLANGWLKLHRIPVPWAEARLTCLLEGARLASPISKGLAEVMRTYAKEEQLPDIHTGIQAIASSQNYISSEGVPLSRIPITWAAGQPDNLNNSQRCLAMTPQGEMEDTDCEDIRPFFCYKKKDGFSTMNECGYHDKTYQVDPATGHCYKLHQTPTTWHMGLTTCSAEGGHLAVINSEAEANFIKNLAARHNEKKFVSLGFYTWYPEIKLWQTLDGYLLNETGFERWQKGQPNNLSGQEHCGSIDIETMQLNGRVCSYTNSFLCEIPSLTEQCSDWHRAGLEPATSGYPGQCSYQPIIL
ncbi:hypothetical protein ABMA28_014654 [Loxostege sticticalis]|uniref:C-type lectin domain-containing protein n=1 Tax=Loxostege sticticalis TaxID=481309 RepID=A0ABD0TC55_LOXSC